MFMQCKFPLAAGVALLAVLGDVARAADDADDEVTRLISPESSYSLGLGYIDHDNQRFGQYTGLRDEDLYGILDMDFVNRDDDTGTWLWIKGRNLGYEDREGRAELRRQGEWGYFASYSATPRYNPFFMNTALAGIGSSNLTVGGTAARDVQLKTLREAFTLGADRRFRENLSFRVSFRDEQKDGARQFARGTPGAMEFLAEPIDQTMRQLEAAVSYLGRRLQLDGGYYATAFNNESTALNISGGNPALSGGAAPFTPIALPPDNDAHQLFLSGGYSFTPTARGTFKAAYTRQNQDDAFILPSTTGRTDLGGRVQVTLLQMGFTARPLPQLSLNSQLRHEDRNDKTPIARYFSGATPTSTFNGDNEPRSIRTTAGKIEASYLLPFELRLTGGVDYEVKARNASPVRVVSARDETRELSYRAELRRSLSETLTGSLAYVRSDRGGSPFLTTVRNDGSPGSNLVAPLHFADRDRDKARLMLDWTPLEPLSVQLVADYSEDEYGGRTLGLQSGRAHNYSLDASYVFSESLQGTLWGSRGDTRAEQLTQVNAPTGQLWRADLRNHDDAYGVELRSSPQARLDIGAAFEYFKYRDEYNMTAVTGAPITPIPDIVTNQKTLRLFAALALRSNAGLRLDFTHDRWRTDDWSWATWVYTDSTRVLQDASQDVNFIALSGYLKLW